jgi:hypothetical protein
MPTPRSHGAVCKNYLMRDVRSAGGGRAGGTDLSTGAAPRPPRSPLPLIAAFQTGVVRFGVTRARVRINATNGEPAPQILTGRQQFVTTCGGDAKGVEGVNTAARELDGRPRDEPPARYAPTYTHR